MILSRPISLVGRASNRMKEPEIRYYQDESDDFFETTRSFGLPKDYRWVRKDWLSVATSWLVYSVALAISYLYCRFFLHVRIKGKEKLPKGRRGYFVYGNHTQPVGDVFIPAHGCFPRRIYTVVSTANYALPIIGKLLPYLGALPIGEDLSSLKKLKEAIALRIDEGHPIVIYPEAHVWEYYTGIREFPATSFHFPVANDAETYCMTATYQKRRFSRRPSITVFLDGPFVAQGKSAKEKAASLRDQVHACMTERSRLSEVSYIRYIKRS